jgi:hypothetical protein
MLIEKGFYSIFKRFPRAETDPKSRELDEDVIREA